MVALALVGTGAAITFAFTLAKVITSAFANHGQVANLAWWLTLAGIAGLVRATVSWAQELLAQRTATSAKTQLRQRFFAAIDHLGAGWLQLQSVAALNLLITTGLDALDAYFAKFLPQLVYSALAIPLFLVVTWATDPLSGIILLCTLPLIPLFMVLIGWVTESVQTKQLDAQTRLARHFYEVVRGITTLRVFGRTSAQLETIKSVSEEHRKRTMRVLRVSFLSGFALELIASLSVALIAVSIGLRLVNAEIGFAAGLFVLLLAPDAYLPLRQIGAHFHASAEGVAAAKRVLDVIDQGSVGQLEASLVLVEVPRFETGRLTVLTGPSGAGKSSLFASALGVSHLTATNLAWLGETVQARRSAVAWMPQRSGLQAGSVLQNITGLDLFDEALAAECARDAGLNEVGLGTEAGEGGSALSGGQAQRVALARTLYRMRRHDCPWLWLDEPTSALDDTQVVALVALLQSEVRGGRSVAVITHDQRVIAVADKVIEVAHG